MKKPLPLLPSQKSGSSHGFIGLWLASLPVLPSSSGVYWFLDENGKVLYVGKAKNLQKRISNYSRINRLPADKKKLVCIAHQLKFQILASELEALLTEAELIRVYQPEFNILLKDDKSPLYIEITQETFPRVLQIRKMQLSQTKNQKMIFGPFHSGYMVTQLLKIARRIFPWCNQPQTKNRKPCFYYHLELCPGPCCDKISVREYQSNIKKLALFLRGNSGKLLSHLKTEMLVQSKLENYEAAALAKKQIEAIIYVTKETFRLQPNWQGINLASDAFENKLKYLSRLLKLYLGLPIQYPLERVEGYDVSNIQGQAAAVSMVAFIQGQEERSEHKIFNIKAISQPNDYAMLQEALIRRQNHPEWGNPNLVVIDGGKGQVRAALKIWHWATPVIGIEKNPDRLVLPKIIQTDDRSHVHERVVKLEAPDRKTKISWQVLGLDPEHPGLQLIQAVRDAAHRFSRRQHHRLRTRKLFE